MGGWCGRVAGVVGDGGGGGGGRGGWGGGWFFFFNDTATTEIYTLSLHDALPISFRHDPRRSRHSKFLSKALSDTDTCGREATDL